MLNVLRLKKKRAWLVPLAAVAVVLGSLMALLSLLQSKLIYFPTKEVVATPSDIGLAYEAVRFEAADGTKLTGWFVPAERERGVLLICHGNAGNIGDRLDALLLFHELGLSSFIFDYRGYGGSDGEPDEEGTYRDAEAAWDYLVAARAIPPEKIILLGSSLGGPIAARLAVSHRPAALILESTFTSIPDVAAHLYPLLPVKLLARFSYDTLGSVRSTRSPLLVVHSKDDEMIPFAHGQRLFDAAPEPKELLAIAGSHNEGIELSREKYVAGIDRFVARYVAKKE
jgi:uncharacterized protein